MFTTLQILFVILLIGIFFQGISYLIGHDILEDDLVAIAKFLSNSKAGLLKPDKLSEYLKNRCAIMKWCANYYICRMLQIVHATVQWNWKFLTTNVRDLRFYFMILITYNVLIVVIVFKIQGEISYKKLFVSKILECSHYQMHSGTLLSTFYSWSTTTLGRGTQQGDCLWLTSSNCLRTATIGQN